MYTTLRNFLTLLSLAINTLVKNFKKLKILTNESLVNKIFLKPYSKLSFSKNNAPRLTMLCKKHFLNDWFKVKLLS